MGQQRKGDDNFYRCTPHLDIIKVFCLPTDALFINLIKH